MLGAIVPSAVTVTTTVEVTMTTVEPLFALVVAAGAGVRVEEVKSAVPVPVDTAEEVD
jgi:hypothetical protein